MINVSNECAVAMRDVLLAEMSSEGDALLRLIDSLPSDDKIAYKPHEKTMTFGEQAVHACAVGLMFAGFVDGKMEDPRGIETPSTRAALRAKCEALLKEFASRVKALHADALTQGIDFFGMGEFQGIHHLRTHHRHFIHHRAQMQLYVRLMGGKCPSIYGPTADVTFEDMMAAAGAR